MAINSTVDLYAPSETRAADGTLQPNYNYSVPSDTITADVQPKTLNEMELKLWGIDIQKQAARNVYDFSFSPYWIVGGRARVDGTNLYRIMAVNPYNTHIEAVIVPLVGA